MNRIRIFIRDEDLDKFDELIYKREEQAMLKSKTAPEAIKFKQFKAQDSSETEPDSTDAQLNHNEVNDENNSNNMNDKSIARYLPVPHNRSRISAEEPNSDESGPDANDVSFNQTNQM
jgi:hypothetical protein